ncbi:PP2C family protein-serine/threonine phosphatase [Streptacidiphilus griseoplanus]|uniref:PP2C family protein-serine/threonine phosphatase n=1 Tax=Peterkaempfera griseoplana TaxID=66896 RepID=UPI001FE0514A|nr:PP2C family protein-serine/threonine phosphatase [Peterkaempfera griseoplana]
MTSSWRIRRRRLLRRPHEAALLSPVILTVLIAVLAFATPREFAVSRLLPAAPALASSMWSVAGTVVLGLVCLLTVLGLAVAFADPGPLFTAAAITAVTGAAAYAGHVRLQRERTLVQVRSVADVAQQVLLRPVPGRVGEVEIETLYLAAAAHARIGGDFYEAVDTAHGVRLLIGDVRGKGLSAVGVAAAVTGCFREAAHDEPDLRCIARRLEASMVRYSATLPDRDSGERFATALLAEVPHGGGCVRLLNCGHPPPLLLRPHDHLALEVSDPAPPLGLAQLWPYPRRTEVFPFAPGETLLLYTDGVVEARGRDGVFYPLADRLPHRCDHHSLRRLISHILNDLAAHTGGALDDDAALLAVRRPLPGRPRTHPGARSGPVGTHPLPPSDSPVR